MFQVLECILKPSFLKPSKDKPTSKDHNCNLQARGNSNIHFELTYWEYSILELCQLIMLVIMQSGETCINLAQEKVNNSIKK